MTIYVITPLKSIVDNTGTAFFESGVGSTLAVNASAYLISTSGGEGAQVYDFSTIAINGTVASYDEANPFDGLDAYAQLAQSKLGSPPPVLSALTLTVGKAGNIYGYTNGLYTTQTATISNNGAIQSGDEYAIQEYASAAGSDTLNNKASGRIIGYYDGLYFTGNKFAVNQTTQIPA